MNNREREIRALFFLSITEARDKARSKRDRQYSKQALRYGPEKERKNNE